MEQVDKCAEDILLKDLLEVKAINLSHGQRRQLELGQALIVKPRLILFDEPASGLSAEEAAEFLKEMGIEESGLSRVSSTSRALRSL